MYFHISYMERVQKILSNTGYCSRREAEELIAKGRVRVNNKKITLGDQATANDKITIDGKELVRERPVYIVFHKPTGCVTALSDERYRTIMHYIKCQERVFPVGRLDMNTSGLLLLTNDGTFANKILHPSYEINKTYVADLDAPIGPKKMALLERGVDLSDGRTSPAVVRRIHPERIEITIHEGKNRIVRRMLEALGYKVLRLQRTKIGNLSLGTLKEGKYKRYNEVPKELESMLKYAKKTAPTQEIKAAAKKKSLLAPDKKTRTRVALPQELLKDFGFKEGQEPKSSIPRKRAHKTNKTPNPNNKLYAEKKRRGGVAEYIPQAPGTRKKPRPKKTSYGPSKDSFEKREQTNKRKKPSGKKR